MKSDEMKKANIFLLLLTACGIQSFPSYDVTCLVKKSEFSYLVSSGACQNPSFGGGSSVPGGGGGSGGGSVSPSVGTYWQPASTSFPLSVPASLIRLNNRFYVADTGRSNIVELNGNKVPSVLAGSGSGIPGNVVGTAAGSRFKDPLSVVPGNGGTALYIADSDNNSIKKIDLSSNNTVSVFAGDPNGTSGTTDAQGTSARFQDPNGVYMYQGNLYVADTLNHMIRKIDASGNVTTLYTMTSTASPKKLFIDSSGILYIFEGAGQDIYSYSLQTGTLTHLAGSGYSDYKDGTGNKTAFKSVLGMTGDNKGNLYVGDGGAVRKIVIATKTVTTVAGTPPQGSMVQGTVLPANFYNNIQALFYDNAGATLYLFDGNDDLRVVTGL